MTNPSLRVALAHIALTSSLGFGVLGTACCAQSAHPVRTIVANVPFAFTSGSDLMPPGKYQINETPGHFVVIRSADLKHIRYLPTTNVQRSAAPAQAKLVFHRYGDQYFLYQVWSASSNQGLEIQKGHAEQDMLRARNNPVPSNAEVASTGPTRP